MPYIDTALKLDEVPVGESRCVRLGDLQVGIGVDTIQHCIANFSVLMPKARC